jgi:hypothetical protein
MDSFITIQTFTHPLDAAIIQSKLESEGIECFLKNEYTINTNPFNSNALGGAELQVKASDFEKAREIINAGNIVSPAETDPESNDGGIICPVCGADQADRGYYKGFLFFLSFLYLFPLFLFGRKRNCYNCGHILPDIQAKEK